MISPIISCRLERLLAGREKGLFSDDEFADHLGNLITADNLAELLERLPPNLLPIVKRGIAFDNQRAVDTEYLQPEKSPFDWMPLFGSYYQNVAALLFESDTPQRRGLLSIVCLPSFEVEWALRLLGSDRAGYSLALSIAEKQIWSSQAGTPVQVRRIEARLTAELAVSICAAWRKMLLRTRHATSGMIGLDGVTYHFACHGAGVGWMAGKTWSPDSQTAPGRLVALSHLLYRYVEVSEEERTGLARDVQDAADWFQQFA